MPIHRFHFDTIDDVSPEIPLAAAGPVIRISIHVPPALESTMREAGSPIPPPISGLALVDTGATLCAVNQSSIEALGIQPIDTVSSGSAAGPGICNVYPGRLVLHISGGDMTWDQSRLTGVNLDGLSLSGLDQPLIVLLGRDFLSNFIFHYDGPAGTWTLAH